VEVTVSCTDIVDDFSVTLLATASSVTNCEGSDSATVNVTVNSKPVIIVRGPASDELGGVCILPGTPPTRNLTFTVMSPDASADIVVIVDPPTAASCSPSLASIGKFSA
jgi:hypothetical protein